MTVTTDVDEAWRRLKGIYPDSTWFGGVHLAENHPRLRRMLVDLLQRVPPGPDKTIVDVGCYNGFLCYLLAQLGYRTAGIDAMEESEVPERTEMMASIGAPFYRANFNHLDPFAGLPQGVYDAAILGEVIEHILTHPSGFANAVGRLLKPGGILLLTTPNPLTLANAVRTLAGESIWWGESEFAKMPKIDAQGNVISLACIHYREYQQAVLLDLLRHAGFTIELAAYMGMGASQQRFGWKRFIKRLPIWGLLQSHRLFGMTHYIVARWTPERAAATELKK